MMHETDAELVAAVRRGSREAAGRLAERYLRACRAVALAITRETAGAEDVCQDAFVAAIERIGDCRDPDRFGAGRREDHGHRMAFHAFGGGVHKCIGMHFAGIQVRAIFHELLRSYRWSVPEDYTWPLDLVALPFPRDRLPVRLERIDS